MSGAGSPGRRALDVAFVVQGEGRGHMTQALALKEMLADAGHRVVAAWLGVSSVRPTPAYFAEGLGVPVHTFVAPTLVPDRDLRRMGRGSTTLHNVRCLPGYVSATLRLARELRHHRPDVVVNFFDLLAGFAHLVTPQAPPRVALAHCYLLDHPAVGAPPPGWAGLHGLRLLSTIAATGAEAPLALSFDALGDAPGIRVVPPLLRPGLHSPPPTDEGHLLVYALNGGYARDVAAWSARNPDVPVHCYVAGGAEAARIRPTGLLQVHDLDDAAFLNHLRSCRAYVGTAGFESVCEAFHLGKPVLAVPVDGHYEQAFNAVDMRRAGVARTGTFADLETFWRDLPTPDPRKVATFRAWVARAPELVVEAVERAARGGMGRGRRGDRRRR